MQITNTTLAPIFYRFSDPTVPIPIEPIGVGQQVTQTLDRDTTLFLSSNSIAAECKSCLRLSVTNLSTVQMIAN